MLENIQRHQSNVIRRNVKGAFRNQSLYFIKNKKLDFLLVMEQGVYLHIIDICVTPYFIIRINLLINTKFNATIQLYNGAYINKLCSCFRLQQSQATAELICKYIDSVCSILIPILKFKIRINYIHIVKESRCICLYYLCDCSIFTDNDQNWKRTYDSVMKS